MNLSILREKDNFPFYVMGKLEKLPLDYQAKHFSILASNANGARHLEAGVVVLIHYNHSEFCFQLIKRSEAVTQAGDISCPGGILQESTDQMLSHVLLETGMIRTIDNRMLNSLADRDQQTVSFISIFLMNALRESWEEIGLSPLNVSFLGALPSYSLTYFSRTIYPLVCLVKEPYNHRLNPEVEKILEIPLSYFFQGSSYATLEITSGLGTADPRSHVNFPCLVIPDNLGNVDILWGATFHIITNFLRIISDDALPTSDPCRKVKKTLSSHYATGQR